MKKLLPLLFLLSIATIVEAAPARHRQCRHCAHPCTTMVVAAKPETTSYNALDAFLDAFSVTAGWRWDRECPGDPEVTTAVHEGNTDPFFVGGELRLPLNSWADLGGNIDRDFVEAPHWNARVFVAAHPWRK